MSLLDKAKKAAKEAELLNMNTTKVNNVTTSNC